MSFIGKKMQLNLSYHVINSNPTASQWGNVSIHLKRGRINITIVICVINLVQWNQNRENLRLVTTMRSYVNATAIYLKQFCKTVHTLRLRFISFVWITHCNCTEWLWNLFMWDIAHTNVIVIITVAPCEQYHWHPYNQFFITVAFRKNRTVWTSLKREECESKENCT